MSGNINKNVWLLGLISFLNDLGSEMMKPLLPLFLQSFGATGLVIGFVGGGRESVSKIFTIIFGYLSDKIKRRKIFVYWGYGFSVIFKFLLAVAQSWEQVAVISIAERFGKALRTAPRDAMIADFMPYRKGHGFGVQRALNDGGAIIGSLIVIFLFWKFHVSMRVIFVISGIVTSLALIPVFFLDRSLVKEHSKKLNISFAALSSQIRLFLVISGVFSAAYVSYMFFILKTQSYFSGQAALIVPVLLYALYSFFSALFSYPLGVLGDKIGPKIILLSGYVLFSIICIGFVFFNTLGAFIILFSLYGVVKATVEVGDRAYITGLAPEHMRATAIGTLFTVQGLVAIPANIIAGALWVYSPAATFIVSCVLSLCAAGLFLLRR